MEKSFLLFNTYYVKCHLFKQLFNIFLYDKQVHCDLNFIRMGQKIETYFQISLYSIYIDTYTEFFYTIRYSSID